LEGNPLQWRWVNEKGVHNAVDSRELVDALLAGRMTPHVWVWRTGWTSWVRASQVVELATAIPKGARLPAVSVAIDPSVVEPPPIPSHSFQGAKYVRRLSTPVPQPMHQRLLVRKPGAPSPADAAHADASFSHTLRPPGAVPPPPRTFSGAFAFDVQRAIDQASYLADANLSTVARAPDLVMRSVLSGDAGGTREAAPRRISRPSLAAIPSDSPRSFKTAEERAHHKRLALAGIAVLLVSAVASFSLFASHFASSNPAVASSMASPAPSQAPPIQPCRQLGNAERLAPSISFNVQPVVATALDGQSLAVGFADSSTSATGILVDPVTHSVKYAFREAGKARVTSVVPRLQGIQWSFAVSRDSDAFKEARVIPGTPDFKFGQTVEGFARQVGNFSPETIWPTDIDAPCTPARVANLAGVGTAVAFRQGGQSGSIQVGWLTKDGHSKFAPKAIKSDAKSVGHPSIATSGSSILVVFAARKSDSDPWAVHTALVPKDGSAARAQRLATIEGGPGGDAIAPVAVGFGDGRFILQWSEGTTGHWQVRVQTLDEHLKLWGPPTNVSPPRVNAGQGTLWVNGTNAVSLFIVSVGKGAELWAASLHCGP